MSAERIVVTALAAGDLPALRLDGGFLVEQELRLRLDADGALAYDIVPVEPYRKRYADEPDEQEPDEEGGARFVAHLDGRTAGLIELSPAWNGYGRVDNLVVDRDCRRAGVAAALLRRAFDWCREQRLPGLMLETQHNNAAACRLYATQGFELRGFDAGLYRGLDPHTREIALFWYWHPDGRP